MRKSQTRLTQFDNQILALSAKGGRTRDIVATLRKWTNAEVAIAQISKVTDACWRDNRAGSMNFI